MERERILSKALRDAIDRSQQRVAAGAGAVSAKRAAQGFLEKARAVLEVLMAELEQRYRETGRLVG